MGDVTGVKGGLGSALVGWTARPTSQRRRRARKKTDVTVSVPIDHALRVFTDSIHTCGRSSTRVTLEHRLLDRLVDGQAIREGLQSGGGWTAMLELFAKAAANQE